MDTKKLVDDVLKRYDKEKEIIRRLTGDHKAMVELKNYHKKSKDCTMEIYTLGLSELLPKYKFDENDLKLSYTLYVGLRKHCAQYYYIKAEEIWLQEEKNYIPIKDRTKKYYAIVTIMMYYQYESPFTKHYGYDEKLWYRETYPLGSLADKKLRVIKNDCNKNTSCNKSKTSTSFTQNNSRQYSTSLNPAPPRYIPKPAPPRYIPKPALVTTTAFMRNELPNPRHVDIGCPSYHGRKIIVTNNEYETKYIHKLWLCNCKIREYNNFADEINTNINENKYFANEAEIDKCKLLAMGKDLKELKNDLNNYISTYEPPRSYR